MITVSIPATDSKAHDIWSTACECNCEVEFMENGNMVICHQAFDLSQVEAWAVLEEED